MKKLTDRTEENSKECKPLFSVVTQHNDESIRRLSEVQYNTFYRSAKLGYYLVCFLLVFAGVYFGGTMGFALLLFACFMVTGANLPAKRNADKVIKSMKGHYPETEYDFFAKELRFGSPGEAYESMGIVDYTRFEAFVEDADYLFLFVTKYGAYVIPKKLLGPDDLDRLKALVEKASGKQFESSKRGLSLRLKDMFGKGRT
jgi:hypothetical protein